MITVDLDNPTRFEVVKSWEEVKAFSDGFAEGRISSSGEGVHIRDRQVLPAEVPINERARRVCGDDPTRIEGDKQNRMDRNQVLYSKKGDSEAGEWTDSLEQLIQWYEASNGPLPGVDHE